MNWKRKRIRGIRRYFRNLQQRAKQPSEMRLVDFIWLARHQQTFLSVKFDPWLSPEAIPRQQEFRALWLARFLQILPHWYAQLKRTYPVFYLAIELYEPTVEEFWHSRLAVAVNERRRLYENYLGDKQDMPLPQEYLAVPGIDAFNWQAYARLACYTPEEFEQFGPELAAKPSKLGKTKQGEPCIIVQWGWVWVGQIRD
jgi:hypothetical protein